MGNQFNSACGYRLLPAAIYIASLSGAAYAQTPSTPAVSVEASAQLEEVVVTAQKREEKLQDVPVPVSVISAVSLVENSQLLIGDYATAVPALALTPVIGQSRVCPFAESPLVGKLFPR